MLHWIIEARPVVACAGPTIEIDGRRVSTLEVPFSARGEALTVTFDEVAQRLMVTPGVYWEPDGSFAWTDPGPPRYRLEGQLADGGRHLQHAELRGTPSTRMLDQMLQFVRGSGGGGGLMFQLVRSGVHVDEATLRELLD